MSLSDYTQSEYLPIAETVTEYNWSAWIDMPRITDNRVREVFMKNETLEGVCKELAEDQELQDAYFGMF